MPLSDLTLMAEAIVIKRLRAMRRNGELGGGGPSVETIWLIIGGVVIAVALLAWVTAKIAEKQNQMVP